MEIVELKKMSILDSDGDDSGVVKALSFQHEGGQFTFGVSITNLGGDINLLIPKTKKGALEIFDAIRRNINNDLG